MEKTEPDSGLIEGLPSKWALVTFLAAQDKKNNKKL